MAHETHQDINHPENKPNVSFNSSFWFVIILVGLFIAAINFVNMSSSEDKEGGEANTESKAVEAPKATATQPLSDEKKGVTAVTDSTRKNEPAATAEKH